MQDTRTARVAVMDPSDETGRDIDMSYAPRPTRMTLFLRTFLPWQLVRFVAINLKMLRLIAKSHR